MFLVYSQSCTIVSQNSRTFLSAQRDPIPNNSYFPVSLLQITTKQIPIPVDLPTLDVLYKWNHTRSGLQCLDSFTQNNALSFIHIHSFYSQIIFHLWICYILLIHSSGHLGYFHFLAIMNISVQVFV